MREYNFYCPKTNRKFQILSFRIKFSGENKIFFDPKTGREIVNPENGERLCFLDQDGDYTTNIGSSKVQSKKKLQTYLKDRSHKHFKKEIAPVKSAMIAGSAVKKP